MRKVAGESGEGASVKLGTQFFKAMSSMRLQPPTSSPGRENDQVRVKMMKKRSIEYEFVLPNWSHWKPGYYILGPRLVVEGYIFAIEFYPSGYDYDSYSRGQVSLLIRNVNDIALDVVYDLHILKQDGSASHLGFSFPVLDRQFYKLVHTVEAGWVCGYMYFCHKLDIESSGCVRDGSIRVGATLGVFIDARGDLPPSNRFILFQVGDELCHANESVITTRCPALLSHSQPQSDHILVSDVDDNVFKALLWFIYNQTIHEEDRTAIYESKGSDPNSFALRILAAADRFDLKQLRSHCEYLVSYGVMGNAYVSLIADCKKFWAKVKVAISQKFKEA